MPPKKQTHYTYISFNKPFGVLSQFTSEGGHPALSGFDLPKEVYAAGRLDRDSEGLLVLCNDGRFIKKLLDPEFAHPRTYWAQVEGIPDEKALQALRSGPVIKGYKCKPCKATLLAPQPDVPQRNPPIRERKEIPTSWLELTLTEGKNRQVRRMTAAVGFPTLRLIRVAIGNLKLGDLEPGSWRAIRREDILP
ncbi:pseudouridine synthase [Sneathiella chinensis]|uniref:Pseudouridine synthase n=1 Tax=Sneathiella chinensis TaxID=349750 RepID=A0ABQ5U1Z6_9PROT|nr:pseudouridine synthase [Sneathiella chinensis]GLQ06195.1 pseudouridine synthase [Sneathiella chinensis]